MTKDQFISGTPFYIGRKKYAGANTFSYDAQNNYMLKQSRSSIDERIVVDDYECNITKVGKVQFEGFTFVMNKKVVVKYRFEDLVIFEEGV